VGKKDVRLRLILGGKDEEAREIDDYTWVGYHDYHDEVKATGNGNGRDCRGVGEKVTAGGSYLDLEEAESIHV
jgi:hypothetical protein